MLAHKIHKFALVFFFCYWNLIDVSNTVASLDRTKRTLIWKKGHTHLRVITGIGVPVDLSLETVIVAAVIRGNYMLPTNVSQLKPFGSTVFYERRKRSLSRWDLYEFLAQLWQMRGFDGKSCLLKTICELSYKPVDKSYSLFDELIDTFFRPSSTKELVRRNSDNEYYAAEKLGRKSGNSCLSKFSDCSLNVVDLFTI